MTTEEDNINNVHNNNNNKWIQQKQQNKKISQAWLVAGLGFPQSFPFLFASFLLLLQYVQLPMPPKSAATAPPTRPLTRSKNLKKKKLNIIKARLKKINKPAVKTIQSPDGDLIDCVPSHHQPAFDHPLLKGQKPLDPPERPKGKNPPGMATENFQRWTMSGTICPEGTIPIRRTREQDMMRASSVKRFGRKLRGHVRRDSSSNGHEHAVGYVSGDQYYGAKASINVWAPRVVNQYEFSLSQMWVISGSFASESSQLKEPCFLLLFHGLRFGTPIPAIFIKPPNSYPKIADRYIYMNNVSWLASQALGTIKDCEGRTTHPSKPKSTPPPN